MNHLKTFENFDNLPIAKYELEEDQVDDLYENFEKFIENWEADNNKQLLPKEIVSMFTEDKNGEISEDFVDFLQYLESNTDWFNFKLMDKIKNDLNIIITKMGFYFDYDEDDEDEFAQDDPEWPYETNQEPSEVLDDDSEDEDEIEKFRKKTYSKEPKMNIDDILDKIGKSGYDSLSDEEKQFLSKQESKITKFSKFKEK
jgi:hypothetical protein